MMISILKTVILVGAAPGRMAASAPDAQNGWTVTCDIGIPTFYAVCAQK
jgi:hypothetical protein